MAQYQEHEVIMEESHCPPEYSLLVERTILSLIRSKQNNYTMTHELFQAGHGRIFSVVAVQS